MSDSIKLDRLLERLARPDFLPAPTGGGGVVEHVLEIPSPFITPEISVLEPSLTAPIVLVSASAAVGKSYLAKYLAATTKNPLWDLSESDVHVGSHFFSGTLIRTYGPAGYVAIEGGVNSGEITLIIDAADEALVKSGIGNYEQALADLVHLLRGNSGGSIAKAVLLGRPEALEYAALILSERGIAHERISIDFFSESVARRFIHEIATSVSDDYNAEDLETFVDLVFGLVTEAVDQVNENGSSPPAEEDEVRSFLGYAPVLDALARLAATGNTHAVTQRMHDASQEMAVWELLSKVLFGILERETDKLVGKDQGTPLGQALAAMLSPEEQIRLLLSEDRARDLFVPPDLAPELVGKARERVLMQMQDHPFMGSGSTESNTLMRFSNVAFRDYCTAWALTGSKWEASRALISRLLDDRVSPSPLLIRFLLVTGAADLPAASLPAVVDSASTALGEREMEIVITARQLDSAPAPSIELSASELGAPLGEIRFRGTTESGLSFNRVLSRAVVDAPQCRVTLGMGRHDFELGPNVHLRCSSLFVGADSVRISHEGVVQIYALDINSVTSSVSAPGGNFELYLKSARYPWAEFRREPTTEEFSAEDVYRAGIRLRRLTGWFLHQSLQGANTYPAKAFDAVLGRGRAPHDWATYLMKTGHLTLIDKSYRLELPVPFGDIHGMRISNPDLRDFISRFLRDVRN